jgi:hypothetical protein
VSRRANLQRLSDFKVKIQGKWQRVKEQELDVRFEMEVRLSIEYRVMLGDQRDIEYEIVKRSGAPKEIVVRLFATTK